MKEKLESNYLIPLGTELRILLNSEHISYGEVNSALKAKGIFCGNTEKSVTVPLLASTLLTPSGYSALIEAAVDRDSKPKVKVSALDLIAKDSDWITPLKKLFESEFNPFSNIENIEVIDSPAIVSDGKDKVRVPFKIKRIDFSKDFTKRELSFFGEISLERKGENLRLECASTHSSKETEAINRRIGREIAKTLKAAGLTHSEVERRITFGEFKNAERVRFFKRLTGGYSSDIGKCDVNDMVIGRDPSGPPFPNDPQVAWMNQTVKRLKIDGDKLNDIFLISDEKYYEYYYIQRMDATYPYTFSTNSGSFRIGFFFSTPSRDDIAKNDADLTFEVFKITHDHAVNADSRKAVETDIGRRVRSLIEFEYEKILKERSTT